MRKGLLGMTLLTIAVAGCGRLAESLPDASSTRLGGAGAGATASSTAMLTAEASTEPTQAPTPEPTQAPTPKPTPKPTKAPLPWKDSGSIDLPLYIYAGTTIRFRLWDLSAPATCSLKFTWPDASVVKLGTKTATKVGAPPGSTNPYGIDWNLTIPSTQVGKGTFTYVCTYLGVTRIDSWYAIDIKPPQ